MQMTHIYDAEIRLRGDGTSDAGPTHFFFYANSMYKPWAGVNTNSAEGGLSIDRQPRYFDQMEKIYNHHVVIGSKMTVKFSAAGLDTAAPTRLALRQTDTNIWDSATSNPQMFAEFGDGKDRILMATANVPVVMTSKYSAKKRFGKGILANSELKCSDNGNCSEGWYYNMIVQNMNPNAPNDVWAIVRIEYITVWFEIKPTNQSTIET
ncbi:putative capsid protein [Pacific flying fox faeces associated circular DNA virus-4]|uniref:Putative capsid protein n=1 Tax=Pacific flying fox faeces associated circular DNA virus-4 TaxID=1796013 RepID=A0A140CTT2_9VIRU|nr:putative capsid protein [Pacific flying fox faeces associated circular DNA virus-4]